MITKTLRTTSGSIKVTIPNSINEYKISQLIEIQEAQDLNDLKVISILSGISEDVLNNILDYRDLSQFNDAVQSLSYQVANNYKGSEIPKFLVFGTKKIKLFGVFHIERDHKIDVIHNLSIEPAGAFLASRNIIVDEINKHQKIYGEENWKENFMPSIDSMAQVLGHYFYCRVTGLPYVEQKAESFKEEILKLPIQQVLPIARYFFLNYQNLLKQKTPLWQAVRQIWKEKRALHRLKSSRSSIR
ncbi:MAG TPA: hypothetical protein VGN20_20485 [Mucilaginibacter sp.]|jgi:hypothetical protein